jgi:hypothetical protein
VVPTALAFSPGGDRLAALDDAERISLWQSDTGKQLASQETPFGIEDRVRWLVRWPGSLRFDAAGRRLLGIGREGRLRSWDLGHEKTPAWNADPAELLLTQSADGRFVAGVEQTQSPALSPVRLHRLTDGKVWAQINLAGECEAPYAIAFSADGRLLALCQARTGDSVARLSVIETASGQEVWFCPLGHPCSCLAFAPDGRTLAASIRAADEILVFDLVRGRLAGILSGHTRSVATLAFSPDGRTLASGAEDHTALLWDATWPTFFRGRKLHPPPVDLEVLWRDLTGTNAPRAQEALGQLLLVPEQTVQLLSRKLTPVAAVEKDKAARLVRQLEDDAFARREQARKELLGLSDLAGPALQAALESKPAVDLKRQLEELLDEIRPGQAAPYRGAVSRSIALLEKIGSMEARRLLQRLADGAPNAYLTNQAQEALQRLKQLAGR